MGHFSSPGQQKKQKVLFFDKIFSEPNGTQSEIFAELKPIIDRSLSGENVTLFGYGMTGSGKTYTLIGSQKDEGILPRLGDYLLSLKNKREKELKEKLSFQVSSLEIYNEEVTDLLNKAPSALNIFSS